MDKSKKVEKKVEKAVREWSEFYEVEAPKDAWEGLVGRIINLINNQKGGR